MRLYFTIWICLLTHPGLINGQTINYRQYSTSDGLSNPVIYRIHQDKHDRIWLTTNFGVSEFDGSAFRKYSSKGLGKPTLGISSDNYGHIWVGDGDGAIYTIKGDSTHLIRDKDLEKSGIRHIRTDISNTTWFIYRDKVLYHKDSRLSLFRIEDDGQAVRVNAIYPDGQHLLFLTEKGVLVTTLSGRQIRWIFKNSPIYSAAKKNSSYFFGGHGKIFILAKETSTDTIYFKHTNPITDIEVHPSGSIWAIADGIPGFFKIKNHSILGYGRYLGLSDVLINDLHIDKHGLVFVATYGKGLFVLPDINVLKFERPDGIPSDNIYAIAENESGTLHVGGYGGISVYVDAMFKKLDGVSLLPNERIYDILFRQNKMWFVTPRAVHFKDKDWSAQKSPDGGGISLLADSGNMLVGSFSGTFVIGNNHGLTHIVSYPAKILAEKRVNKIIKTREGLWFATNRGAVLITKDTSILFDKTNSPLISHVKSITEDNSNNLWFATETGLLKLTPDGTWTTYTQADGLLHDHCQTLFYNDGILWIGTALGLNSFDGKTFKNSSYYGLPPEEVSVIYKDRHSNLWIGTNTALYKVDLTGITPLPPITISLKEITCNGLTYGPSEKLQLPYGKGNLQVSYNTPEYSKRDNIVYRYRLKNLETSWHETPHTSLEYSALPYGEFELQLYAAYKNEDRQSGTITIPIIILPPFWAKWWFWLWCAVFSAIAITVLIRFVIVKIKKEEKSRAEKQLQLLQLKHQATNALLSPHFIFNSLNSIQNYINKSDKFSANIFLSRFSKLIRNTMDNATRLDITLEEELKVVEHYLSLETMRQREKFSYEIRVAPLLQPDKIIVPSMLVQPYVENAIWHGITHRNNDGQIIISVNMFREQLAITIRDNGPGFYDAEKETDTRIHGRRINRERLEIIGQLTGIKTTVETKTTYDYNSCANGTEVNILIPLRWVQEQ